MKRVLSIVMLAAMSMAGAAFADPAVVNPTPQQVSCEKVVALEKAINDTKSFDELGALMEAAGFHTENVDLNTFFHDDLGVAKNMALSVVHGAAADICAKQ